MTINLSAEMLTTLKKACNGRLMLLHQLQRGAKGNMKATRLLLADAEETQAAIDMLNEGGE